MSVSIGTDLRKETGDEVKQEPGAKNKLALESDLIASIVGSADKKKGEGHDLKRPRYNACGGIAKWADQVYKDYGPPDICGLFKAGGKDVADAHKEAAKERATCLRRTRKLCWRRCQSRRENHRGTRPRRGLNRRPRDVHSRGVNAEGVHVDPFVLLT